jgi:hypothetical protein
VTTLDTPTIIIDVERFLHVQYVIGQRKQAQPVTHPADGIVVLVAMLAIVLYAIGGK